MLLTIFLALVFCAAITLMLISAVVFIKDKKEDYARYDKKTLLVLPLNDEAFPQEAQQELMEMLPGASIVRVTGGHTTTLYKVGEYVTVTKDFIEKL